MSNVSVSWRLRICSVLRLQLSHVNRLTRGSWQREKQLYPKKPDAILPMTPSVTLVTLVGLPRLRQIAYYCTCVCPLRTTRHTRRGYHSLRNFWGVFWCLPVISLPLSSWFPTEMVLHAVVNRPTVPHVARSSSPRKKKKVDTGQGAAGQKWLIECQPHSLGAATSRRAPYPLHTYMHATNFPLTPIFFVQRSSSSALPKSNFSNKFSHTWATPNSSRNAAFSWQLATRDQRFGADQHPATQTSVDDVNK